MWLGEQILTALPKGGACVTLAGLAKATGIARPKIVKALPALQRSGYAVQVRLGCYARTPRGDAMVARGARLRSGPKGPTGPRPPRSDTLRARAWAALRMMKKATVPDLLELAARDEKDGRSNLRHYLGALERAGVVARLPQKARGLAATSPGFDRWLLVRDLGAQAPIVRGALLHDPNEGIDLELAEVGRGPSGSAP